MHTCISWNKSFKFELFPLFLRGLERDFLLEFKDVRYSKAQKMLNFFHLMPLFSTYKFNCSRNRYSGTLLYDLVPYTLLKSIVLAGVLVLCFIQVQWGLKIHLIESICHLCWFFHTPLCSKLAPLSQGSHRKSIALNVRNFWPAL